MLPHFRVPDKGRSPKAPALQSARRSAAADGRRTSECPKEGGDRRTPHFRTPDGGRSSDAAALQVPKKGGASVLQSARRGVVAEGRSPSESQRRARRRPPHFRVPCLVLIASQEVEDECSRHRSNCIHFNDIKWSKGRGVVHSCLFTSWPKINKAKQSKANQSSAKQMESM